MMLIFKKELIADFELDRLKSIKKHVTKWNIREEEYSKIILTDVLEICIIELPKYNKYAHTKGFDNINLWIKFIKNPEVVMMENKNDNQETKQAINKAKEKLEQLSQTEHERELAELREKYVRDQYSVQKYGYLKGIEEGKKEGKFKEKIRLTQKMIEENIDINTIIAITGLSKEEIEEIKKSIK
ncbi:MAG: Rpn family recombination-promoting nuclease/putative transposase [Clostridia bacterium]|nr:Rpn family recombination-promoting nuclease/putative transposase [Clostridia bacterium]